MSSLLCHCCPGVAAAEDDEDDDDSGGNGNCDDDALLPLLPLLDDGCIVAAMADSTQTRRVNQFPGTDDARRHRKRDRTGLD